MEKALDGKLRDKNSHRGDKRLMLMERGKCTQWEQLWSQKHWHWLECLISFNAEKMALKRRKWNQPWQQRTPVSEKSWKGFTSCLHHSKHNSQTRYFLNSLNIANYCDSIQIFPLNCWKWHFFSFFFLFSKEEWSLQHKLERTEARIQTLEAQVKKI